MAHHNNFAPPQPHSASEKLSVVQGAMGVGGEDKSGLASKGIGGKFRSRFKSLRITSAENGYSIELTPRPKHIKVKKGAETGATVGAPYPIDKTYVVGTDHPAHKHLHSMVEALGHLDGEDGEDKDYDND